MDNIKSIFLKERWNHDKNIQMSRNTNWHNNFGIFLAISSQSKYMHTSETNKVILVLQLSEMYIHVYQKNVSGLL